MCCWGPIVTGIVILPGRGGGLAAFQNRVCVAPLCVRVRLGLGSQAQPSVRVSVDRVSEPTGATVSLRPDPEPGGTGSLAEGFAASPGVGTCPRGLRT